MRLSNILSKRKGQSILKHQWKEICLGTKAKDLKSISNWSLPTSCFFLGRNITKSGNNHKSILGLKNGEWIRLRIL
jgi:hypothetical protein